MQPSEKPGLKKTILTAITLLAFFAAVYSLGYSGTFLTDDEHILASRSLSLAFDEHMNISRVIGNSRVFQFSQMATQQALEGANIEPAQAVLGALLAKLSVLLGVGRIQMMFLLNIWVTACTAIILYLTAIQLGYSGRTGVILAGLFGFGTIAFPYSQTFFRDPLAMLFLACAWLFAHQIGLRAGKSSRKQSNFFLWLFFVGVSIAGILAKNSVVIAIPVMLIEILGRYLPLGKIEITRSFWKKLGFALGVVSALLLIWFLVIPRIPSLVRFSPTYYDAVIRVMLSRPRPYFFQALIGPFISPGKSIFLFSPVLLLSFWCLIFHFRSSWSAWLYLFLLVVFQALFYGEDWAGRVNWGLRYVLPAIPPLVLSARAGLENLLNSRKGWVTIIIFGFLSVFVQLMGVLSPVKQYFIEKSSAVPQITNYSTIWQTKQSILGWSAGWIFNGKPLELAVWRNPGVLRLILPVITLVIVITMLYFSQRRFQWSSIISLAIVFCLYAGMMFFYKDDPAYLHDRTDLKASQDYVYEHFQSQDLILVKSYGTPVWTYWMNWSDERLIWTALPFHFPPLSQIELFNQTNRPEDAFDTITLSIFNEEVRPGRQVWILIPDDSPGAGLGLELVWLGEQAVDSSCQDFLDNESLTKLCWFEIDE